MQHTKSRQRPTSNSFLFHSKPFTNTKQNLNLRDLLTPAIDFPTLHPEVQENLKIAKLKTSTAGSILITASGLENFWQDRIRVFDSSDFKGRQEVLFLLFNKSILVNFECR